MLPPPMHDASSVQPSSPTLSALGPSGAKSSPKSAQQPHQQGVDRLEFVVRLFRLLGDATRLSILTALTEGERNVGSLCQMLDLPQPTVSHHLGLMRINRLIDNRRSGKQVFYALSHDVEIQKNGAVRIHVDDHYVELKLEPEPA